MEKINESLSSVIYHFCNFENGYNIAMSDKLILTSAYNTASDLKFQRGKLFYISFTRQFSGNIGYAKTVNDMYSRQINKKTGKLLNKDSCKLWVRFTFNGDSLSNIGRGIQVNNQAHGVDIITNRQSEDRLITDVPYIDNVSRYIIGMDILLPSNMRKNIALKREKMIRTMIISSRIGSKIRVFTDEREFNNINSTNYINPKEYLYKNGKVAVDDINQYDKSKVSNLPDLANALVIVNFGENFNVKELINTYNLVPLPYREELEKIYLPKLESIRTIYDIDSFKRKFSNLRMNIKGESKWLYSNAIKMITDYMRKRNLQDISDLVKYKKEILKSQSNMRLAVGENSTYETLLKSVIQEAIDSVLGDKKKVKLAIFDFDGTLVDTTAIDNYREKAKSIKDKNIRLEFYRQFFNQTRPYSGIVNVLNRLNSMGIFIAVVSLSPMNMVKELCRYHGLPIQAAISVPGRKTPLNVIKGNQTGYPKSAIYRQLMTKLGIEPDCVLAIGDEITDAQEARKANINFLGCNWGGRNEVNDISNPNEILNYV